MDKLEKEHMDFLRVCAGKPNSTHPLPENVSLFDAEMMAAEGLLISYHKSTGTHYAIGRYGTQFVKESGFSESPEMKKLAVDYVITKGYETEAAESIVAEHGVEKILGTQAEEIRAGAQREVKIPVNERGEVEVKFRS